MRRGYGLTIAHFLLPQIMDSVPKVKGIITPKPSGFKTK
jgi:hypothetical protein